MHVSRLTLFIEESICNRIQWAISELNNEQLWNQIRSDVSIFMDDLFKQGIFKGSNSDEAYFVKCGRETITQEDIDNGIMNIMVGFAPLKPAEFVIIRIDQLTCKKL